MFQTSPLSGTVSVTLPWPRQYTCAQEVVFAQEWVDLNQSWSQYCFLNVFNPLPPLFLSNRSEEIALLLY